MQGELFKGIFKMEPLDESLLLPYERKRISTMILCLKRLWPIFTDAGVKEVVLSLVYQTPARGLDVVATFAWLFTGEVPAVRTVQGDVMEFDPGWMRTPLSDFTPWLHGVAGSAVLHRVIGTARWYPNDWDIYCMGDCVRVFFVAFIEALFQNVREDGVKRAAHENGTEYDLVRWWRVGIGNGIRLNLVMSYALSKLETFDIDACACNASVPFHTVMVPSTLQTRVATMKTHGVMTKAQHLRWLKYVERFRLNNMNLNLNQIDELYDYGYGEDSPRPFENVF